MAKIVNGHIINNYEVVASFPAADEHASYTIWPGLNPGKHLYRTNQVCLATNFRHALQLLQIKAIFSNIHAIALHRSRNDYSFDLLTFPVHVNPEESILLQIDAKRIGMKSNVRNANAGTPLGQGQAKYTLLIGVSAFIVVDGENIGANQGFRAPPDFYNPLNSIPRTDFWGKHNPRNDDTFWFGMVGEAGICQNGIKDIANTLTFETKGKIVAFGQLAVGKNDIQVKRFAQMLKRFGGRLVFKSNRHDAVKGFLCLQGRNQEETKYHQLG